MDGYYLGDEVTLSRSMATWPHHIDRSKCQYSKSFSGNSFFGADLVDHIHKQGKVILHLFNTACIEDVETGEIPEFGELQRKIEQGKWIKTTPIWVELTTSKKEEGRKSDSGGGNGPG